MMKQIFILMRPWQAVKNLFVFAPLIFSKMFLYEEAWRTVLIAFVFFCVASSMGYIINDIFDRPYDKKHPLKKSRPLAKGALSVNVALRVLAVLGVILVGSFFWNKEVAFVLMAYVALTISYSAWLKHIAVLDIFVIALGFMLRIFAGGLSLNVNISAWMFITVLCLALYLGSVKRYHELKYQEEATRSVLKAYSLSLMEHYCTVAAICAIVFYGLFVVVASPSLVVSIPFVLFGFFRYGYVAQNKGEDPTRLLLTDGWLFATVILWAASCMWLLAQG